MTSLFRSLIVTAGVLATTPVQVPASRVLDRARAGEVAQALDDLTRTGTLRDAVRRFRSEAPPWIDGAPAADKERRTGVAAALALGLVARGLQQTTYDYNQAVPLVEWMCERFRTGPPNEAERLFHLGSIALLQGAHDNVRLIGTGLEAKPKDSHVAHAHDRFPDEPRFKLASLTMRRPLQILNSSPLDALGQYELVFGSGYGFGAVRPEEAIDGLLRRLGALLQDPAVGDEALMRRGVLQFLIGRTAEAETDLRQSSRTADPFVRYLSHLTLGQLYERTGEMTAAIANYSLAAKTVPATAAVMALASALYRENRRVEAAEVVGGLMRDPRPDDPWRQYEYADYRHFPAHLKALERELVR